MRMVEKKILRDIIISLKTGLNPRSNFVLNSPDSNIPYITGKDIFENRVNITEKTDLIDIKALNLINKRACLEDNLLLFASTGTGTVGRMAIINKYDNDWGMSETLYAIKTKDFISPYFLMYSLYSHNIKKQYEPKISKGSVPHLKVVDLLNVQIPIPSIQEQKRIVGILDTFTSSIDNLKQQIAQRRKQYEFYRDQLLDLEGKEGVEMRMLGEICDNLDYMRKPITSSKRKAGIYPYYGASGIVDYVEGFIFDGEYLLVSEDGANLVARTYPIAFSIEGKNWVNNHAHVLAFESKITQKFVEIYLNMIDLSPWINGAAQPKLNQANLNTIIIPVPSLSEQQRIVDILDKFETSIHNLEAQLSQREKQYEYYRNKLLTFE